ncbi:MAG: hypothetical protein M3R45_01965 [Pseudomonadota bacterium]|nr:hypothetical protein [Pseudomonadota bacterium]
MKHSFFVTAGVVLCLLGANAEAQGRKLGEPVSQIGGPAHLRASGLVCSRPASAGVPAHNVDVDRCHGNWLPTDNTGKWHYQASPGPDHMVRNNGNPGDRSCMKCPNGGHLVQDAHGSEDWCVNTVAAVPGWPAASVTPSCPSGFSLNAAGCTRPASAGIAAHNVDVDRCHGNWMPTDNTGKWHYQASPGPDHMVRNNGNPGDRSCMKCPNGGHLVQDAHGNEDWCVNTVAAVPGWPAASVTPSCPSGFALGPQ